MVEYTYDELGRVTKEEYFENESETASRTVTYTYNETGNLSKMTDSKTGMTTTYSYDPLGRLVSSYETDGTSKKSSAYSYYATGDLKTESYLINSTRYQTVYEYDPLRRVKKVQNGDLVTGYGYDAFSRLTQKIVCTGETGLMAEEIAYQSPTNGSSSNRIVEYVTAFGIQKLAFSYVYDANGNISSELRGILTWNSTKQDFETFDSDVTTYKYDKFNRLSIENNQQAGKSWVWTYDSAGNITSKKEYPYGYVNPIYLLDSVTYTYGNSSWGDLLTAYDGRTITYDTIGNPLSDGIWTYTWEQGRQLVRMQGSSATWNYTYDTNGLRTQRSNGTTTYRYWYNDSGSLLRMEKGNTVYSFTYDASGRPVSVTEGNTRYYYVLNQQGDVVAIINGNGDFVVEYYYDAWGRLLSATGTLATTLGVNNPLRYRGYVYDTETELYYLQSRYYNPEMGRFINADDPGYMGVDGTPSSYNLFAYCGNNPVTRADDEGKLFHIIIGAAVGAFVGLAGQFISDLSTSFLTGDWSFSNWQTYAGATIGGAFGGAVFGATGCVGLADAVSGFVSTGVGMSLEKLTGAEDYSWEEISLNAVADGAVSYGLGKLPGINKATKGRNSWSAVYKSGLTKLRNKTVSHMSKKVIAKGVGSGLVGGLPMNGYGLIKQFAYDPIKEYILGLMR